MAKKLAFVYFLLSSMSSVLSWSSMAMTEKIGDHGLDLDLASSFPTLNRRPKKLQDDSRTTNPFMTDNTFGNAFSNNGFGSVDSLTSFNSDQFSVPQPMQESVTTDFDLPENFRTTGNQEMASGQADVPGGIDFSQGVRKEDGRLCVMKEIEVDTLVKDPVLECTHKNVEKCHYTYITQFKPSKEEICEENFEKKCQITFKQMATSETVKKCYKPLKKVCNGQGPEQCRTVYESSCTTKYMEKEAGKFVGDTQCERLPIEICGAGCVTEEQPEECHDKEVAGIVNVPDEVCDLNPQKVCRFATRLVPVLTPKHECTIIPKETCHLRFEQPRLEKKPLRSEWCLDESGPTQAKTYDDNDDLGLSADLRKNAKI